MLTAVNRPVSTMPVSFTGQPSGLSTSSVERDLFRSMLRYGDKEGISSFISSRNSNAVLDDLRRDGMPALVEAAKSGNPGLVGWISNMEAGKKTYMEVQRAFRDALSATTEFADLLTNSNGLTKTNRQLLADRLQVVDWLFKDLKKF